MKKVYDMGGRRDEFGPIDRSDHQMEDWEVLTAVVGFLLVAKGIENMEEDRRAMESLDDYQEMSYYERGAAAMELLAVEKGLLTKEEIDARAAKLEQRWGEV